MTWAASIILQKAETTKGKPTKPGQESHVKGGPTPSLISIGSLMLAITTSVGILMGIPMACGAQQPTQTLRTHISHFWRLSSDHQLQNCTFCNGMASGSLSAPLFVPNHPPGACRIFHNISCSWKMSTSKWTHPSRDGPPYWQKNRPFFPIPPRQTPSLPRPAPKTHEKVLIAVHCQIKTDRGANEQVFTNKTFLSKESTPKHTWYLSRAPQAVPV